MTDEPNETGPEQSDPTSEGSSQPSDQPGGDPGTEIDPTEYQSLKQQNQQLQSQYSQLEQAVNQYFQQAQNQQAAQTQTQDTSVDYDELEDEWITSPGKASQKLSQNIQNNVLGQVQQLAQPILQAQAQTAKATARQDPSVRDVFEKYGSEVESKVANMPQIHKANPQLWVEAAKMVKADHFDELLNERAQELAARRGSETETGSTRSGSGRPMKDETVEKLKSSSYGRKLLNKYGADGLRDHVNRVKSDLGVRSFEEYVDMVSQTETIHDSEQPNQWKNRNLVRDV